MRPPLLLPPVLLVRLRTWLMLSLVFICATGISFGDRLPEDPVEAFRQALKLEANDRSSGGRLEGKALDYAIKFRESNLTNAAKQLRTIDQISRALLLVDWPYDPAARPGDKPPPASSYEQKARIIEREIRTGMTDRLIGLVRKSFASNNTIRIIATANLVGETVSSANSLPDKQLYLDRALAPLAKDLTKLADNSDSRVQAAAALALGHFPSAPEEACKGLRVYLSRDRSESTRQSAAEGVFNLILIVSGYQLLKGSEPGILRPVNRPSTRGRYDVEETSKVIQEMATVATYGLEDPSAKVRRRSITAMYYAGLTLVDWMKITKSYPRATPPRERPWSDSEKRAAKLLLEELEFLRKPLVQAMMKFKGSADALSKAVMDPDPQVQVEARRTLEVFAQSSLILRDLKATLPAKKFLDDRKKDEKEDKFDLGRRDTHSEFAIAAYQGKEDGKKEGKPAFDEPEDPLGELLHTVGDNLVRNQFRDPLPASRRAALEAIESFGKPAVRYIRAIAPMLKDEDLFVRWIAARAVGKLAPEGADLVMPGLISMVDDVDLDARNAAMKTIGLYGPKASAAVPALGRRILKGDVETRIAAMKALEGVGTTAVPALSSVARSLEDEDARIRGEAARVLGRFGPLARDHVGALQKLSTDPDSEVRKAVSAAVLSVTQE